MVIVIGYWFGTLWTLGYWFVNGYVCLVCVSFCALLFCWLTNFGRGSQDDPIWNIAQAGGGQMLCFGAGAEGPQPGSWLLTASWKLRETSIFSCLASCEWRCPSPQGHRPSTKLPRWCQQIRMRLRARKQQIVETPGIFTWLPAGGGGRVRLSCAIQQGILDLQRRAPQSYRHTGDESMDLWPRLVVQIIDFLAGCFWRN